MRALFLNHSLIFLAGALVGCGSSTSGTSNSGADTSAPLSDGSPSSPIDAAADQSSPADRADAPPGSAPKDGTGSTFDSAAADAEPRDGAGADGGQTTSDALRPDGPSSLDVGSDSAPALACGTGAKSSPPIKGPAAAMTDSDQTFRSLVVDPTNADVVFIGSEGNGIFRTRDGGKSWSWLRAGLRYDGFPAYAETWDLAIAASDPNRIYAAMTDSPGPVAGNVPSARGGVFRSDDGGDSWRQVGCDLPNAKTASVWVDPTNRDLVIAGLEGGAPSFTPPPPLAYYPGGLWKSTNGGESWTELTLPAGHDHNSYWRIIKRGGKLWTFALDGREMPDKGLGFLSSADGVTFAALPTSFAGKLVPGWDVSADGMTILASERDTFKMQRSTNGGMTFAPVDTIAQARANGPIAQSPGDPKVVLFASNNEIHRSEDALASSTKATEAPDFVEDIAFATSKPEVVYASVRGLRVYRSADAGKTWTPAGNLRADVIEKN